MNKTRRGFSRFNQDAQAVYIKYRTRFISPLMRRILLVNTLPLVVLVATLLYLNQFQNSLLGGEVLALREQARIYAGALGQSAVKGSKEKSILPNANQAVMMLNNMGKSSKEEQTLSVELAKPLLLSLTEPSPNARARVYAPDGQLVADSRVEAKCKHKKKQHHDFRKTFGERFSHESQEIAEKAISSLEEKDIIENNRYDTLLEQIYDRLLSLMPYTRRQHIKNLSIDADPDVIPNAKQRLRFSGESHSQEMPPYIRRTANHRLFITVAEPIIHQGQTIGIIQLTREAKNVDRSLFAVRSSILMLFLLALAITVLLSWYLSLTIARPLLRLATSAHAMREAIGRSGMVPDRLLARRDEIGDLARALQDSAKALWGRMDAIERFSADVSHELKNPLSSIRSAIELLPRVVNDEHRERLLFIITDDVRRLDRLITDIATSSRIEAEMSRLIPEPVAIVPIFRLLADMNEATKKIDDPQIVVEIPEEDSDSALKALAIEDRLVQVLRNLIGNAASFSPSRGKITLAASIKKGRIEITVSDQGPGIPEAKLGSIFERFYTERPQNEDFGQHSGLGLSICRQIIVALKGSIMAHNLYDDAGKIIGACFVISLPKAN